jgi:hypothetical protein
MIVLTTTKDVYQNVKQNTMNKKKKFLKKKKKNFF